MGLAAVSPRFFTCLWSGMFPVLFHCPTSESCPTSHLRCPLLPPYLTQTLLSGFPGCFVPHQHYCYLIYWSSFPLGYKLCEGSTFGVLTVVSGV